MSGYLAKLQTGLEVAYGTAAALDRAHEFVSEGLELSIGEAESKGIRSGDYAPRDSRTRHTTRTVSGDIDLEVETKGFGRWFKMLTGDSSIAQIGATTAYKQTHIPGATLPSATVQVSKPLDDGTASYFTYLGCVVTAAKFSISPQEIMGVALSLDGRNQSKIIAGGAATYPSANEVFDYAQGVITADAVPLGYVTSADFSITNALKTDRHFLGGAGLKNKPVRNGDIEVAGTLNIDWSAEADALHELWLANTAMEIVWDFTGAAIVGGGGAEYQLTITLPAVRLQGKDPTVGGKDLISLGLPFRARKDESSALYTIEYTSNDAAI